MMNQQIPPNKRMQLQIDKKKKKKQIQNQIIGPNRKKKMMQSPTTISHDQA